MAYDSTKDPNTKGSQADDELANALIKKYNYLSGNRGNFETHWNEIAERMLPAHSNSFSSRQQNRSQGEKRTEFIFDSTAVVALTRFSAIVESLLTPRNQTWHRILATDTVLNRNREVRLWFEDVNRLLFKFRYAPQANFSSQNQQQYMSLGAYGTGCMFIDDLVGGPGFRYKNCHLGEVYFDENHQGMIDEVVRHFKLTARQAAQKWGKDNLPEQMLAALSTNPEQEFIFLHCVKPRGEELQPEKLDYRGMPFASYYVSMEGRKIMSKGGFNTFPYAISRYVQSDNEVYGRSPAMDVLPAVKTLNEEKKTVLKQGHRIVDPVLLAHDDGIVDSFSLKPGAINAGGVSADGRPLVHTLPTGNLAIGKELMDDERKVINDAFLISIFQILVDTPTMSATEVLERTREKGILLAPVLGRQQSEYLGPLIDRELDLAARQGILPPMPQMLMDAKGEYRTEYDSPLSRAQRAEEAAGLQRTIESTLQIINITQDPAPMDHFNFDEIVPAVADIQGVPESWMRSKKDIDAIRAQRGQQQQTQALTQAAPGAAALIKADAMANKA